MKEIKHELKKKRDKINAIKSKLAEVTHPKLGKTISIDSAEYLKNKLKEMEDGL